jgi:signal transduction histidine kinase
MFSKNLKKSAILYAMLIILLKCLADIYYFQASSSIVYILISTLLLIVITLVIMFPVTGTDTINYWKGNKILTNLSHEFRTPMIGIIGTADLLEREDLTSAQFHHLENIKQAGFSLLNIIDNVLDLSKLELGQVDINLTPLPAERSLNHAHLKFRGH